MIVAQATPKHWPVNEACHSTYTFTTVDDSIKNSLYLVTCVSCTIVSCK